MPLNTSDGNSTGDILDDHQAAELLRIGFKLIRKMVRRGEIPCQRCGAEYRFSRRAIMDWLAEGSVVRRDQQIRRSIVIAPRATEPPQTRLHRTADGILINPITRRPIPQILRRGPVPKRGRFGRPIHSPETKGQQL